MSDQTLLLPYIGEITTIGRRAIRCPYCDGVHLRESAYTMPGELDDGARVELWAVPCSPDRWVGVAA